VLKFSDFLILLGIVLGVIVTGLLFLLVLLCYNRCQRPREHKAMPLNPPLPYQDISQQASVDTRGMSSSFTCTIGSLTFPQAGSTLHAVDGDRIGGIHCSSTDSPSAIPSEHNNGTITLNANVQRSEQTNDVESLFLLTGALAQYPTREIMPPTAVLELDISTVHNSDDGASKTRNLSSSPPVTPSTVKGKAVYQANYDVVQDMNMGAQRKARDYTDAVYLGSGVLKKEDFGSLMSIVEKVNHPTAGGK
jgi:hypothetical protein